MASVAVAPPKSPQLPAAKLTAIGRFKSFTGSLASMKDKRPMLRFPPPSWNVEDFHPSSENANAQDLSPTPSLGLHAAQDNAPQSSTSNDSTPEEPVEPFTFAKRLRAMIELLPIPGTTVSVAKEGDKTPEFGNEASPSPVPPEIDPGLVKMLSSEDIMNGDAGAAGKDKKRPSIWNILAGLRRSDSNGEGSGKGVPSSVEAEEGGVMMYAPLEPMADSQVSLAESETVIQQTPSTEDKAEDVIPTPGPDVVVEKRVWVPSTTEISVLTAWWGYRLYLPPPVMAKLGESSLKAAARAAMVTSALKWMLDKIPLVLVPLQFRPAVKMLKTLTPIAGYVGVFIAWSWDRIRALDEGNGVVLTATWLLPVALLPMAWDAGTIYRPILLPDPEELQKAELANKAAENDDSKEGDSSKDKKKKSKLRFW